MFVIVKNAATLLTRQVFATRDDACQHVRRETLTALAAAARASRAASISARLWTGGADVRVNGLQVLLRVLHITACAPSERPLLLLHGPEDSTFAARIDAALTALALPAQPAPVLAPEVDLGFEIVQ